MSKRRRLSDGQQRLFAPKKINTGKLIGVRKLNDILPDQKPDIVGLGSYRRIQKPSKEVKLYPLVRMFFECLEDDEIVDSEEWWNKYYSRYRMEMGPSTFKKLVDELIITGLIEHV